MKISPAVRPVHDRERCYVPPSWVEAPTESICTKICVVVAVPNVITCAKVGTEIFRGYHFTVGRIFGFSIDSFVGLRTV